MANEGGYDVRFIIDRSSDRNILGQMLWKNKRKKIRKQGTHKNHVKQHPTYF